MALIAAVVAATFATRSAAGADASGYLSQARLWSDGAWVVAEPLAGVLERSDGWLTTPLGWRPAGPSYQVPTYPPGLPLLMSLPHDIAGINGATAVVVASAAIAVWATGMAAGGIPGIIAAILIAFSPVFLYQSFQPMSDVPVTAAWMICFLLISRGDQPFLSTEARGARVEGLSSALAGIACGIAILIRPNLAPLAIVPIVVAKNRIAFTLPVIAAGAFLALMQWLWYGSPVQSGYGSAEELFAFANVVPNAVRYFNWLIATAPVLLLAPIGFVRLRQHSHPRALALFATLVIISYLVYGVFEVWSYLRFLLPALAVMAILAAVELAGWIERWPLSWRAPILLGLLLAFTAHGLSVARALDVFRLAEQSRRVEQVGDVIKRQTSDGAVILSGEQSGAMRYYTQRSILRWEAATPSTLSTAIATLAAANRPVYIVLDAWENDPFLAKFGSVAEVALDWPPMVEAGTTRRTRLWRLDDRAAFLKGQQVPTVRIP